MHNRTKDVIFPLICNITIHIYFLWKIIIAEIECNERGQLKKKKKQSKTPRIKQQQKTPQFAYLNTLESVLGNLRNVGNLGLYQRMIKGINICSTKHVHFDML